MLQVHSENGCMCGCGDAPAGKKSKFRMGHDMRLRGRLIRAHLKGERVQVDGHTTTALEAANKLGWGKFLKEAEKTRDRAAGELIKKAKANPRLEKIGKTKEYAVVAVYANSNGSKDIETIDLLGKKGWAHIKGKGKSPVGRLTKVAA